MDPRIVCDNSIPAGLVVTEIMVSLKFMIWQQV